MMTFSLAAIIRASKRQTPGSHAHYSSQPHDQLIALAHAAARKFAPGLTQELVVGGGGSGRWVRKGNTLVIYGA